jgi:hypothetical protein
MGEGSLHPRPEGRGIRDPLRSQCNKPEPPNPEQTTSGGVCYIFEKTSVKGVGYEDAEIIITIQKDFNGTKLVEKESGSGNVIFERTMLEAKRQINSGADDADYAAKGLLSGGQKFDYINFSKEAEFRVHAS